MTIPELALNKLPGSMKHNMRTRKQRTFVGVWKKDFADYPFWSAILVPLKVHPLLLIA